MLKGVWAGSVETLLDQGLWITYVQHISIVANSRGNVGINVHPLDLITLICAVILQYHFNVLTDLYRSNFNT